MPSRIAIELLEDDADLVLKELHEKGISAQRVSSHGFDGSAIITLIVDLTAIAAPVISAIYLTRLRAKRHVLLKVNGIEVRGVSEDALREVLNKALSSKEKTAAKQPRPKRSKHPRKAR